MSHPTSAATSATVRIERDIVYGEGSIGHGSERPGTRPLMLDAYLPAGTAPPGG